MPFQGREFFRSLSRPARQPAWRPAPVCGRIGRNCEKGRRAFEFGPETVLRGTCTVRVRFSGGPAGLRPLPSLHGRPYLLTQRTKHPSPGTAAHTPVRQRRLAGDPIGPGAALRACQSRAEIRSHVYSQAISILWFFSAFRVPRGVLKSYPAEDGLRRSFNNTYQPPAGSRSGRPWNDCAPGGGNYLHRRRGNKLSGLRRMKKGPLDKNGDGKRGGGMEGID